MRRVMGVVAIGVMAVVMTYTSVAVAQEATTDKVVYKKKTFIDFTDAVITGELTRPEGSYIVNRKISRFSNLIRYRGDFVPELLRSQFSL